MKCIYTISDDNALQNVLIFFGVSCGISFILEQTNRKKSIQKKMTRVAFEVLSLCLLYLSEINWLNNNTLGARTPIEHCTRVLVFAVDTKQV